jgi:hypothetical protein
MNGRRVGKVRRKSEKRTGARSLWFFIFSHRKASEYSQV